MGSQHTPGCEIIWTEVGFAEMRDTVQQERPVQFRFGVRVDPAVWDRSSQVVVDFQITGRGALRKFDTRTLATETLPGRPSPEFWLGLGVDQAANIVGTGIWAFRPQIWFSQGAGGVIIPGEFAVGDDHYFVNEIGMPPPDEIPPPPFTGGPGRPSA